MYHLIGDLNAFSMRGPVMIHRDPMEFTGVRQTGARSVRVRNRRGTARVKGQSVNSERSAQHDQRLIGHLAVNGPIHRRPVFGSAD